LRIAGATTGEGLSKKQKKFAALKAKRKALREAEQSQATGTSGTAASEVDLRLTEIRTLSVEAQQALFWQMYIEHCSANKKTLSPVELKEGLGRLQFVSCGLNKFDEPQHVLQAHSLLKKIWKPSHAGAPLLESSAAFVLVSPSAIRANQFAKSLRKLASSVRVLKLFGKHMKLSEQRDLLTALDLSSDGKQTPVNKHTGDGVKPGNASKQAKGEATVAATVIVVGTPGRLLKLSQNGSLSFHRTQFIVVDSARNDKQLSLFSMKEVCNDFFQLYKDYIQAAAKIAPIKICLY